ncbi:Gfo/Idh/MocA family oxidoreductase [Ferrimicrobium sp.]|uniref:Gfo/Idh/MocA family protein n=1 Tax=Ferrimicrobium sp. TaxID=2926050 RepID=UPI0026098999|nr:Gfo/Idh/MocA family oxidoreductase [Ferrimicrobium sp.]
MNVAVCGLGSQVAQVGVIPALRRSRWTQFLGGTTRSRATAEHVLTGAERHYRDYDAILSDPDVEAVYLPLPNDLHLDFIAAAVLAHKHVLCEKPLLLSDDQYDRLERIVASSTTRVSEAFMSSYHPRLREVIATCSSGEFGEVLSVSTAFTGTLAPLDGYRLNARRGGGSLYDVGIYALFPIVALLGADPREISVVTKVTPTTPPVDLTMHCLMEFDDGRAATFVTSFVSGESQSLRILTQQASIAIDRTCTPTPLDVDWTLTTSAGVTIRRSLGCDPYQAMIDEVFEAFTQGREPSWNLSRSRQVAQLLHRINRTWREDRAQP